MLLLSLSLFLFCFRKREKATTRSDDDERRSSFRVFCERSFFDQNLFLTRVGITIAFLCYVLEREKKKGGKHFQIFIVMFVTPKRDDDDVNDAEEEEEEHRTLENRGEEKKSRIPPLREEKTSPEEHESAAILFELMTCTTKNTKKTLAVKSRKKANTTTAKTKKKHNDDDEKGGEMDGSSAETTPPVVGTKRRLSSKFNRAMMMVPKPVEEEKKMKPPKTRPVLAGWYSNAKTKKKRREKKEDPMMMFPKNLNDFIDKRLFKAGENVVPKSWIAFARSTARGEDAAVREAATCSDYAQDKCKKIIRSKTTSRSKKNNENNKNGDDDDDDDDDDGDDDENNENDAENEIDRACRRARYVKGVTKLSTDLIRRNPSAAWLECLAADAHDRARQIRKTKKICEKMRKQSIAWMYKMNKIAPTRATSQEAAVEDVSTIALANVCANWELGLAREMEIYIDQLENVELISDKAMAINGEKTDVDVRAFSMEQFERSNEREHQKAKHLVTKLRTHSEKVAALWRHDAKGRNDF